jgi:hypothetical protein
MRAQMMKQIILAAAVCALAGCAAPEQTATVIPPSATGCYYRVHGILLYGTIPITQPRYEPAPCNVVNANQLLVAPAAPPSQTCTFVASQAGGVGSAVGGCS